MYHFCTPLAATWLASGAAERDGETFPHLLPFPPLPTLSTPFFFLRRWPRGKWRRRKSSWNNTPEDDGGSSLFLFFFPCSRPSPSPENSVAPGPFPSLLPHPLQCFHKVGGLDSFRRPPTPTPTPTPPTPPPPRGARCHLPLTLPLLGSMLPPPGLISDSLNAGTQNVPTAPFFLSSFRGGVYGL